MTLPPSELGGRQETVAVRSPPTADAEVGADGAVVVVVTESCGAFVVSRLSSCRADVDKVEVTTRVRAPLPFTRLETSRATQVPDVSAPDEAAFVDATAGALL